jgi:hypothetical protein
MHDRPCLTIVGADREGSSAKLSEGDGDYRLRLAGCGSGRPLNLALARMSIAYAIVADWPFYRTSFARYRQQKGTRWRSIAISGAIAVIMLSAWVYGRSSCAWWTPIPEFSLIGGIIGALGSVALVKILTPIRIRRSPGFGAAVSVTLDDYGLHAIEAHGQTTLAWAAFTRVVRFEDGLLFLRGRIMRWLPDAALKNSTPEEATAFVLGKTDLVHAGLLTLERTVRDKVPSARIRNRRASTPLPRGVLGWVAGRSTLR